MVNLHIQFILFSNMNTYTSKLIQELICTERDLSPLSFFHRYHCILPTCIRHFINLSGSNNAIFCPNIILSIFLVHFVSLLCQTPTLLILPNSSRLCSNMIRGVLGILSLLCLVLSGNFF